MKIAVLAGMSEAHPQIHCIAETMRKRGHTVTVWKYHVWHFTHFTFFRHLRSLYFELLLSIYRPDFVLVTRGEIFQKGYLKRFKKRTGCILANWSVDDPFTEFFPKNQVNNIGEYDYYFIFGEHLFERLKKEGTQSYLLPCAAIGEKFKPLNLKKTIGISFVGTRDATREKILSSLTSFDLHIYGKG